ncbi:MAG: dihydroxy-acid dehydratase [Planctomycetaceae bacterium]|nr:dihydroxy-acid dehydratase [Planctomycetaceae bacterium]
MPFPDYVRAQGPVPTPWTQAAVLLPQAGHRPPSTSSRHQTADRSASSTTLSRRASCCSSQGASSRARHTYAFAGNTTSRHLSCGKRVAVLTDARFSGVSTGTCIGHISPEALAGGPLGKVRDGGQIRIVVDRINLRGSLDLVGAEGREFGSAEDSRVLAGRSPRLRLSPDPELPDDTRLWAALQAVAGGTWGGCVHDTDAIIAALQDRA